MPKPSLKPPWDQLERDIITTLIRGLRDIDYPRSYSDMESCVRALLREYQVTRRLLPIELPTED